METGERDAEKGTKNLSTQRQDIENRENCISPNSFMSSSIQSNQISSFELDEVSSGGTSWRIGMPWFRNTNRPDSIPEHLGESPLNEDLRYYGGLMKPTTEAVDNKQKQSAGKKRRQNFIQKVLSNEDDSLADFDDSEWTPQDSAYGAACPVCGWIPKHVRRMIEFSMIAGMVLGFVYLLVTTSIHITNDRKNSSMNNSTSIADYHGGQIALDDDLYVEYNRNVDDYSGNDDDNDYFDDDYTDDDDANTDDAMYNY